MSEMYESLDALAAHTNGAANDPDPTIPDLSDPEDFVTELSAATRFFESQAVVRVRVGDRVIALKIRSVPKETLEQAMLLLRPKLPKYRDKQTGLLVVDEDSRAYRQWLQTYVYIKVVLGLAAMTLRNRAGTIVWQSTGEIQELAAAVAALKEMGITTLQVDAISRAIDALSQVEAEQETEALLGN